MASVSSTTESTRATSVSRVTALRWAILFAALGLFALHAWFYRFFTVDDTYITLRFVRQWVAGNGLVFNIGERVEGYSNFLWIVLLAPFGLAGADLDLAARTMGALLSIVTLILTWRLSTNAGWTGVASLLLAASAPFAAWSVAGLESPLVAALVTISVFVYLREEAEEQGYWSGLWFGLLALARPDGLLFAGIAGILRIVDLRAARRWPTRQDWVRLAIFVPIVVVHFAWRWSYYGELLPNTVYAKSMGGSARGLFEGLYYVYRSLNQIGGTALIVLTSVILVARSHVQPVIRYGLVAAVALMLYLVVAGGDWMPLNRFIVHALPLLYLIVEGGLHALGDRGAIAGRRWLHTVTIAVLIGFLLFQAAEARLLGTTGRHHPVNLMTPMVKYLEERRIGEGDVIAAVEVGYLGYRLPLELRIVDVVGLTDRHIAHLLPQFPGGLTGRGDAFGKWDPDYVLAQEPQYIQMWLTGRNSDGTWQTNFTGTTILARDTEFLARYRLVTEPGVTGLFVRIDK